MYPCYWLKISIECVDIFIKRLIFLRFQKIFSCLRVGRSVQYSEDSETGDGQRKRFRLSREEEDVEAAIGEVKMKKKKKKKKSWNDQEPSTSHALEVGCMNFHFLLVAIAQMIQLNFSPPFFFCDVARGWRRSAGICVNRSSWHQTLTEHFHSRSSARSLYLANFPPVPNQTSRRANLENVR